MFGSLGTTEIIFILVIALIIFGPRKLPQLGRTIGESLAQFRRASEDFKRSWEQEITTEEKRIQPTPPPPPSTSVPAGQPVTATAVPTDQPVTATAVPTDQPVTATAPPADTNIEGESRVSA
jgi:TatA/E family protein of Tat protein translocase